jgi:RHS repeat-associated protein
VVRTTTNAATTGHKLSVLLADHLGTANTSVDIASGQAVTRRSFKPYGEVRGTKPANWPNKRSYLGTGIDDAATGLTNIGAREYDQSSGRFLSADPLIDIADPLQMNGYSYAKNSPISTSDPDGLKPVTPCDRGCDDGDDSYRDWMTQNPDGTWSYHSENTRYVYEGGTGDLVSTTKRGSEYPGLGKKTVFKGYKPGLEHTIFKVSVSLFMPDSSDWVDCFSGSGVKSCAIASTDLPWLKALKLVPNSVIEKGTKAVEDWLSKRPKGCKCFLAGTDVLMADGTTEDIEDVELGDRVLATDPETGETAAREVTRLIRTEGDKHFNELSIATEDGIEKLTATHEHPFWSPSALLWVEARDLKPGMTLLTHKGDTVVVTGNRAFTRHARTYNLTVDDLHTYYVLAGATPVLVHNSGGCPTVGSVDNLMENLDDDVIFHYSDQKGYEGILGSGTIRADSKGRAYVTQEMVSPGDIHNVLFAGNPAYAGKGGFMIAIRRREGVSLRVGEQPNELIHQGSLRFDRSDVLYAGPNPFG